MGIQSTREISRQRAIERIVKISDLIVNKNYRSLEDVTDESDYNLQKFVDSYTEGTLTEDALEGWTDTMVEEKVDEPFFRHSQFDNYQVV